MKKLIIVSMFLSLGSVADELNTVVDITPDRDYTEVCFKEGKTLTDISLKNTPTTGGNCNPGDVGFIIESNEREAQSWQEARTICTEDGMRLPEPFEWQLACHNAKTWSINKIVGNWEWASNVVYPLNVMNNMGMVSAIFGFSGCHYGSWEWVAYLSGSQYKANFRCAL